VSRSLSALSLYSGAGGLDLGFGRAGFRTLWANELDIHAAATYAANLDGRMHRGDVLTIDVPALEVDVVIGGPPCQSFSRIGRMDPHDPRGRHVDRFLSVVDRLSPRAFVLENVAHLAEGSRWRETRMQLKSEAIRLGYTTEIFVLDASHFGVPQARRRMFMIGVRGGRPIEPKPTTAAAPPSVRAAFAELPPFGAPGNDRASTARIVPAKHPVLRPSAFDGSLLFNGSGRPLRLDRPAKSLTASMGGNATPIVDQLELDTGADAWVEGYLAQLLEGESPVNEVPSRLRRLTTAEAAALQSFPPDWKWVGPTGSVFKQIGNAVPPLLAEAVAKSVRSAIG
jgi:DNA (cytosine-5)-methyltransferase 1